MQIGFVKNAKNLQAIILDQEKYIEAANYSIEKEKVAIASSFYSFILFIFWLGFGLNLLDSVVTTNSTWLKAVIFIDLLLLL